jgi:hypothetical protein
VVEKNGQIRLESGLERLEEWSGTAGQAEQDAVYQALFAIADGSVSYAYLTYDDVGRPGEFFVLVREDLVVKVVFHDFDSFGIAYIGTIHQAPGHDLGIGRAE